MAYVQHRLGAMILLAPQAAREEIIKKFREAGASRTGTARLVGVHNDTMRLWIRRLKLTEVLIQLEREAIAEGWHHGRNRMGGKPKGSKNRPKDTNTKVKTVRAAAKCLRVSR